jgi:hypothetical protein
MLNTINSLRDILALNPVSFVFVPIVFMTIPFVSVPNR